MSNQATPARAREGSLEAPARHPIDWRQAEYYDQDSLFTELERVYDICHGCRRCVNLCQAFPTLFDLIDESETMEVDGVAKEDYGKVVDHCYLCDLCYMTKCPYVPPHEWNVDFPHLMLRAKAQNFKQGKTPLRDRALTSTQAVGNLAGIPVVAQAVNAANRTAPLRKLLEKTVGIHAKAALPEFHSRSLRKRVKGREMSAATPHAAAGTNGKVALFVTCYVNRNMPQVAEDLISIYEHNGIPVTLVGQEVCCGMPKLELGDLDSVARAKDKNIPALAALVEQGWDVVAPIPSCVLMFKQELPLMFPDDEAVAQVQRACYDPFEYLALRHKQGLLNTDFKRSLGKVLYHAPCHQRVQNIGRKTCEILALAPDTSVEVVERCSGHDGTYAVKVETHEAAVRICRPVVNKVKQAAADYYASDCPMAGAHIQRGLGAEEAGDDAWMPLSLLRLAYGV